MKNTQIQKDKRQEQRKKSLFLTKKISKIFSSKLIFKAILNYSLTIKSTNDNLSLHQNYKNQYFKDDLVVFIETEKITHFITSWICIKSKYVHSSDYFIANFNLLEHCKEINRLPILRTIEELLSNNFIHKNTQYYKKLNESIKNKRPITKQQALLDTEEKVDNYFNRIHALYQSITRHGLISNKIIAKNGKQYIDREIGIAINNDGSLIKLQGGQHRFAIAKIKKIEKIPVEIRLIHKDIIKNVSENYKLSSIAAIDLIKNTLNEKSSIDSLLI